MALSRLEKADNVMALARELGISRILLYRWASQVREKGEASLKPTGRPRESGGFCRPLEASEKIAELEGMIGRQQVELDFFRAALQQVRGPRRRNGGPGDPTSTR